MKLQDIETSWADDCVIQEHEIIKGNLNIPKLHAKYWRIMMHEKLYLYKLEAEYKAFKRDKQEFLLTMDQGLSEKYGWKPRPIGKILRQDLERLTEGDDEIISKELEIGVQREKVDLLKSILQQINQRTFIFKNIIEEKRFENGG